MQRCHATDASLTMRRMPRIQAGAQVRPSADPRHASGGPAGHRPQQEVARLTARIVSRVSCGVELSNPTSMSRHEGVCMCALNVELVKKMNVASTCGEACAPPRLNEKSQFESFTSKYEETQANHKIIRLSAKKG